MILPFRRPQPEPLAPDLWLTFTATPSTEPQRYRVSYFAADRAGLVQPTATQVPCPIPGGATWLIEAVEMPATLATEEVPAPLKMVAL